MTNKPKVYFNWSSGKDAALAFYKLQREGEYSVDRLLTSINAYHNRVSMHGLRRELLKQQVESVGLPVTTIELPEEPSMDDYNHLMSGAIKKLKSEGYSDCVFGDIFLEDLRIYREEKLKPHGITSHFPLWKTNTKELITEFINLGFKAITISIKADLLDESFVGRIINQDFVNDLPENVDPCGENGEFHTFCYDGPIFTKPIPFTIGEKTYREYKAPNTEKENLGFWFCDLLPIKS